MREPRISILTIGATLAVALVGLLPATAQAGPWCAHYAAGEGGINCGFAAYEQCAVDLRGIGGWCARNMFYNGPDPDAAPARSVSRQRPHKRRHDPR